MFQEGIWFYSDKLQTKVREWMREREREKEKKESERAGEMFWKRRQTTYQPDKLSKVMIS